MNSSFDIGDIVQVINTGGIYSTFPAWAQKHNLVNYDNYHSPAVSGELFRIVCMGVHGDVFRGTANKTPLLGLENIRNKKQHIINDGAPYVKLVKKMEAQLEFTF